MATLEEIQQAGQQVVQKTKAEAEQVLSEFVNKVSGVSVDKLFNSISDGFKKYSSSIKEAERNLSTMSTGFDRAYDGASKLFTLFGKFDGFRNFSVQGGSALNSMRDQFDILANRFGNIGDLASKLGPNFMKAFGEAGVAGVRQMLSQIENAEKLENSYISLMAASGQLGAVYQKSGEGLKDLSKLTAEFSTHLLDTADIMGMSTAEVASYAAAGKNIPGLFDQIIEGADKAGGNIDGFTAALKLARGAGVEVGEVLKAMENAYDDLSNANGPVTDNIEKGQRMFALMSEAAQKLNLRFSDSKGFFTQIADQFKNIGDNTEAAAKVMDRFMNSLRDTGLTTKASLSVIQEMVGAVGKLEIGTKALISQRTGGPGGLQGAFRVDQMIRQGRSDEVVNMIQQTLRQQFRGRIYTQEEAANSPQAAAQFMRQRTMLESGAFGSLAKTPETATRLLEAMAKGDMGGAGKIVASGMEALKQGVSRGSDLTERQYTVLNDINTSMDRSVAIQTQQLLLSARNIAGTNNPAGAYAQEVLRHQANIQERQASHLGRSGSILGRDQNTLEQETRLENRKSYVGLDRSLFGGGRQIAGGLTDVMTSAITSAKEGLQGNFINSDEAKAMQGRAASERAVHRSMASQMMMGTERPTAARMPMVDEKTKHEVEVKPINLKIDVRTDQGTQVNVSSMDDSVNITQSNRSIAEGGITRLNR